MGDITTVAGNGTAGFSGDGGAATAAQLGNSLAIAADAAGNVFITDRNNSRIRKVTGATGVISTVAGNGTAGFSGDGGPATAAQFQAASSLAVDGAGNLFIVDENNRRIRKVAAGIISTLAGNGTAGFSGDGGPATAAQLGGPGAVAVDGSGNLFIADRQNHRIRRVDATTGVITTVAGTGIPGFSGDGGPAIAAQLYYPTGVVVDGAGNVFIGDDFNHRVRKVAAATAVISTVAGNGTVGFSGDGGPATAAQLRTAGALATDGAGNLFILDYYNQRIRMVTAATGVISTVAGTGIPGFSGDGGAATAAQLNYPSSVAVDGSGNLFISDDGNLRIRKVEGVAAGNCPAGALFCDDFNDNSIDPSKWTSSGNTVTEQGGIMMVDQAVTDQGGVVLSTPIAIAPNSDVTITRKVKVHYANQYHASGLVFFLDGDTTAWKFMITYRNYVYSSSRDCPLYGFYIVNDSPTGYPVDCSGSNRSPMIPPKWDTWFDEKIIYHSGSGLVEYFIDGAKQAELNVGHVSPRTISLSLNGYGWYTGHYQYFDDIVVTQAAVNPSATASPTFTSATATPTVTPTAPPSNTPARTPTWTPNSPPPTSATTTPTPGGVCQQPKTDLAIVIDSSGSIDSTDFALEKEGFARSIQDSSKIPQDGSVCVTVIRFANSAVLEVPYTCVEDATTAAQLAAQIRGIAQVSGGTGVDLGISLAASELARVARQDARQLVLLATDGISNVTQNCDQRVQGRIAACPPAPSCSSLDSAISGAIAAGVDELNVIAIEDSGQSLIADDFTNFYGCRVFPSPNSPGPPPVPGFVITVPRDFNEFARVVAATMPALSCSAHIDLNDTAARPGGAAAIHATLTNAPGGTIAAAGADITFDPAKVAAACNTCQIDPAIGPGSAANKGLQCGANDVSPTERRLRLAAVAIGNTNPIPDGPLFACTVTLNSSVPLGTLVPLRNSPFASDANATDLTVVGRDGSIRVTSCPGDCNANGEVTLGELVKVVRVLLGQDALNTCSSADGNGDGRITIGDAVLSINAFLHGCN